MNKREINHFTVIWFTISLVVWVLSGDLTFPQTQKGDPSNPPPTVHEEPTVSSDQGEVLEREIRRRDHGRPLEGPPGKTPKGTLVHPPSTQAGDDLPVNLCHQETQMMPQCRCFNNADCQVLSTLCPGSCPVGSQSCQCVPLFRGTPPALPPNLCGYQVPFTITKCSCSNDADCQVLSPFCPESCPVGSHTCQCTPLQRR